MKRTLGFAKFLFLASGWEAYAQNGGLRGTVLDQDGQPLAGVEITLEFLGGVSREVSFRSDDKGTFVRMGVRLGEYRITFEQDGYDVLTEEIQIPAGPPTRIGSRSLTKKAGAIPRAESAAEGLDVHFAEGNAAVDAGDYAAAIAAFEKALELVPESSAAHFNLGLVHRKMENPDEAIEHFGLAIASKPEYYEAYVAIGDIETARGAWAETIVALEKAVAIRPDSTDALYNLGGAAMNLGGLDKAKEAFQTLIAVDPAHAAGHYQLGMIAVNQTENETAIRHLERYLELEPDGPQAASAKGILDYLKQS